ncbi:hypothetical protein HNR23_001976 [Nocardiopsis mwathae]|uniref:DUF3040 domain-containing protein n=1 Tax=Nocardiopsis mwathae TaxID=1472723 RepID=A0A7W9YI55_9ACTN|nr:DUF3040 domain-containing protein [Nocardiopsis mwathae]MBB6171916.1 hypothetical protein [Nocardiopsis mwathae]
MSLSRSERERLRAIEEQLRMEDPEFAEELERCAERIPEDRPPDADTSASLSVPLMLWAAMAAVVMALILALAMSTTGGTPADPADGAPPPTTSSTSTDQPTPGVAAGQGSAT